MKAASFKQKNSIGAWERGKFGMTRFVSFRHPELDLGLSFVRSLFEKEKQKDADNADLVFMYPKSGKLQNSSVYNNISYTQSTLRGMR